MTRIDGKTAVVTGSGNGIGRAMALAFAAAGANVTISDVLQEDGERTVREITGSGGSAYFVPADVADADQAEHLIDATVEHFGGIDILANKCRNRRWTASAAEIEPADFDRVIDVNLRGTFLCSKFAIPHFLAQHDGRIVNTASTYGLIGAPKAAAYCASKAGIINLTRQMAVDYGPDGIRVNAVCPGYIDTGLGRRGPRLSAEEFQAASSVREKAASMQPLRRQGQSAEVGEVALFLVSCA